MVHEKSKDELLLRACERIACVMKGMLEDRNSTDTRLFGPPLVSDELVAVGRSKNDACCREHVIPRLVICNRAEAMLRSGAGTTEVARFIAEHLKIIYLTQDECDQLNKKKYFNLRQRMPKGWEFGQDQFARLQEAEISYTLFDAT